MMKSYIFVDKENEAYGRIQDGRLMEMYFYNEDLGNIYRAKIINKIDSINAYFLEYAPGKQAFLKSNKNLSIGDSVLGEIVRPASNKKLALFSVNYKLESENYELYRFPRAKKASIKEGKERNDKEFRDLNKLKASLEREENFNPTPKLLLEKNSKDLYVKENSGLKIIEKSIFQDAFINQAFTMLKDKKVYHDQASLIFEELETLTAIDINTSKAKTGQKEGAFFDDINRSVLDFLAYNLKLRNIGGMVVIDFLRGDDRKTLEDDFKNCLDSYGLEYEIYGFTNMGLFELTLKRKGESLRKVLKNKNII
ncbi:MAG: ribonuclease E/G [Anaerococcus sp.]|nr:ribonuclease E/G [Peptoniphilaceae bacterium]MDY3055399.1 ribonuclease E/G [Anaerococcus sp.]